MSADHLQNLYSPVSGSTPVDSMERRVAGRRAEDIRLALHESRYRALVRASADIVWTTKADGTPPAETPEWLAFTGQTREELGESGWLDALHPEDREIANLAWLTSIESGSAYDLELRVRRHDGEYRFMRVRAVPVRDELGRIVEWVGTHTDITGQKNLEHSLRERERELKEAHRLARFGSWTWDVASDISYWTEEVYRIYEVDPQRPTPSFDELETYHSPESRERMRQIVARTMETGEPYFVDNELILKDGRRKWIAVRGEVESRKDGKVTRLRGTIQDITERKSVVRALENAHQKLENVLNSITDGLAVVDRDWYYTYCSEQGARMVGLTSKDLVGKCVWDLFPDKKNSNFYLECVRALETAQPVCVEEFLGEPINRWLECNCYPSEEGLSIYFRDITGRKLAEEISRQAYQRLESVLNSITDGLAIVDRDWRYTYFSERGGRILGLDPKRLIGGRIWDLFPHVENSKFGEHYRRAMTTGEPAHFEEYYPGPLNKWIEVHCYPSEDGLSMYFRDITERKQAEEALRVSESRFRKLFESDLMGIAIPDRFGAFREGNDEFLRIVGYTRDEIEAGLVRWDKMTPREYAELDAIHIAEAEERGSCTPYEKEYIRKDGSRVPILCGYALLEGSRDVYVGFVQDLSKQKQTEEALREREQRFSTLAESLPQLIFVTDARGTNTYCNRRLLRYAGVGEDESEATQETALRWVKLLHPDDLQYAAEMWRQCQRTGEHFLAEHRLRRHDGEYRWFLTRAVPVRNDAGEIEQWLGSSTDTHDQKLAEEALRRSEKLAATGRLAASVAHEINNPLTSVTNAVYLALQDESLSESTRKFLKTADEELARVAHVTTQTLRFFRQSTAPAHVDISRTVDSVIELFSSRLKHVPIEVIREYRTEAKLLCFSDELRQVFANLIGNAIDAMRNGGRLKIRIRQTEGWSGDSRGGIVVSVADNGSGIPGGIREHIFEPFVTTKRDTGTGLGLWVTQGIVQKHRGSISVRSDTAPRRHGSVFSIFLPFYGISPKEANGTDQGAGSDDSRRVP